MLKLPADVQKLKDRYMHDPEHVSVSPDVLTVEKIDQKYISVDDDRKTELLLKVPPLFNTSVPLCTSTVPVSVKTTLP